VLNSQTSLVFKLVIKQQMPVIQISLVKMLDFKQQLLIQISLVIMLVMGLRCFFSNFIGQVLVTQHQVRLVQILSVMAGQFSIGASQSNFIGYQAGVLATNASGSTFIGSPSW
jgi:hypothetical protein